MPTSADEKAEAERIQAERREYVKNIGIEYRFGCYEEKRADSCQLLAEYMEAIELNTKGAFSLFKTNCEQKKYPKSCYKYAMYLLAGKECEPSLKKMIEPLETACQANIPGACRYLSLVYWNGEKDRPADSAKAEKYMKKWCFLCYRINLACELEDAQACWLLSTWFMGPMTKFITTSSGKTEDKSALGQLPRRMDLALKYGIRACDLQVPESCANVGRMYKIGDGVSKDPEKAKEYLDKAKEIMLNIKQRDAQPGFTG
uniref:Sel1 repeat family protein n=1 Tax=Ascaris lumbricoides TaxID=6252 RepID=A0A0M3I8P6_ASCLU